MSAGARAPAACAQARSPVREVLTGAVLVAVLDICDALIFWGLRGGSPIRIFQSIAAGLLGRSAYAGGLPTALLGAGLHFFIASSVVTTYYLVSRKASLLTQKPVACGLLYGLLVYLVMYQIVLPLSATPPSRLPTPGVVANNLLIHALGVGLPSALFARRAELARREAQP